jgi:SAM-dependent methyltransferase
VKAAWLGAARAVVPGPLRVWLAARWPWRAIPPVGAVRFGSLRRLRPLSYHFGFDRGQPIDRYYIESFLGRQAGDVRGRVLEVGDPAYTRRFGGARVVQSDVLHVTPGHPQATIIADLARAEHVSADLFDCIILTQTLHVIYDFRAALQTVHRILRPGGVLLATFPGISQISRDAWQAAWYWSFTPLSARRLLAEVFDDEAVEVTAFGNVLAAASFLYGIAAQELRPAELDAHDPHYPMLVAVRAVKRAGAPSGK